MTNQERAEKIVEWISLGVCKHQPATPRCNQCMTEGITEQLDEAVREAVEDNCWQHGKKLYAEGFAAAREKAALLFGETGYIANHYVAERIRNMECSPDSTNPIRAMVPGEDK